MREQLRNIGLASVMAVGVGTPVSAQEAEAQGTEDSVPSIVETVEQKLDLAPFIEGVDKYVDFHVEHEFFDLMVERANAPDNYRHFIVEKKTNRSVETRYYPEGITEDTTKPDSRVLFSTVVSTTNNDSSISYSPPFSS